MPTETPLTIFLSPHFDDIALSCGGMAARLSRMGARGLCIVVFAAPAPNEPLSDYAQSLHDQWESASGGQTVHGINAVRREEERQAMRILGLQPVWLDLADAPYRQSATGKYFYNSDEELFAGPAGVAPEERRMLVPRIAGEIKRVAGEHGARGRVRVFAPLGVGRHVDHTLVFWAARRLGPRFGVLFYEDFPYVARPGALEARINELNVPMQPRVTSISDLIGVKIAAIARYKSQLGVIFGSSEAMPKVVREYAAAVAGGSGYAERFWRMPPTYTLV